MGFRQGLVYDTASRGEGLPVWFRTTPLFCKKFPKTCRFLLNLFIPTSTIGLQEGPGLCQIGVPIQPGYGEEGRYITGFHRETVGFFSKRGGYLFAEMIGKKLLKFGPARSFFGEAYNEFLFYIQIGNGDLVEVM